MPLEHALRRGVDGGAVGYVALLVLVGLGRGAREPDGVPSARFERADELGADAG